MVWHGEPRKKAPRGGEPRGAGLTGTVPAPMTPGAEEVDVWRAGPRQGGSIPRAPCRSSGGDPAACPGDRPGRSGPRIHPDRRGNLDAPQCSAKMYSGCGDTRPRESFGGLIILRGFALAAIDPRRNWNLSASCPLDLHHQREAWRPSSFLRKELAQVGWGNTERSSEVALPLATEVCFEGVHARELANS